MSNARPGDRLVRSPVFLLSSVRSGSTLLRCILNTHSRIRAPHELHLADLEVQVVGRNGELAMTESGLSVRDIEHLLWDRMLHRELVVSGKDIVVDKTPGNLLLWRRLRECWPAARFLFLLRHPLHVLESSIAVEPSQNAEAAKRLVACYLEELVTARRELPGLTVRYEDLTLHPDQVTQQICEFLEVPWEAGMVEYGKADHGSYLFGIGDSSETIQGGVIVPGRELPPDLQIPEHLRAVCSELGYLGADQ
ncbi:sulfotransferase family protein [Actinomadura sp. 6N118]|uniref:sulfotransferase family protein n=1 Tax=Actinomadura sp. 6N118 TaxID=3375151 RepID=UPI0037A646BD